VFWGPPVHGGDNPLSSGCTPRPQRRHASLRYRWVRAVCRGRCGPVAAPRPPGAEMPYLAGASESTATRIRTRVSAMRGRWRICTVLQRPMQLDLMSPGHTAPDRHRGSDVCGECVGADPRGSTAGRVNPASGWPRSRRRPRQPAVSRSRAARTPVPQRASTPHRQTLAALGTSPSRDQGRTKRAAAGRHQRGTGRELSRSLLLGAREACERFLSLTLDARGAVFVRGLGGPPK